MTSERKPQQMVDEAIAGGRGLTRGELDAVAAARRADRPAAEVVVLGDWTVRYEDYSGRADWSRGDLRHAATVWLTGTEGMGDGGAGLARRLVPGLYASRAEAERAAREFVAAYGPRLRERYDAIRARIEARRGSA